MSNKKYNIESLIKRFWNGETTLNEEHALYAYFDSDNIAEPLKKYKSLFNALSELETGNTGHHIKTDAEKRLHRKSYRIPVRYRVQIACAAATIAVLFTAITWLYRIDNSDYRTPDGSYMIVNSRFIKNPETVAAKVSEILAWAETIEQEAESIPTAKKTEHDMLNSINDPAIRNNLKSLLN